MRIPGFALRFLQRRYLPLGSKTLPDEIIAPGYRWRKSKHRTDEMPDNPFLLRWFIPGHKSRYLNRYLHCFVRNDEDRALHDHPWFNFSILLQGSYIEHTIDAGGVHKKTEYHAGEVKLRTPWAAHRVELLKDAEGKPRPCWSLFITGPVVRTKWGFHCENGWRSSDEFHINGGCDDPEEYRQSPPRETLREDFHG